MMMAKEETTDPKTCKLDQISGKDQTCVNPTCPLGLNYNEDIGECLSYDFPTDPTCPDGSKGIIRDGPNEMTLIECPLPIPDSNPPVKPGLDPGKINNNVKILK